MQNNLQKEKSVKKDSDYAFAPVPAEARRGLISLMAVMVGFSFNSGSMAVGAKIGLNSDFYNFIYAIILGGGFLSLYTGTLAYISSKTGLSFDLLCTKAFGSRGSKLPSLFIALTQTGWFGVCSAMFAIPVAEYLECSAYLVLALAGIFMTYTAYVGFRGLEILSYFAVPMILLLGSWSIYQALSGTDGGLIAILSKGTGENNLNMLIGLVIGSFISGGTTTPNFARFAQTARYAVISTVSAFMIGNSIMLLFGAVGASYIGQDDIFFIMISQGLVLSAFLVLGANIWSTNDNALYSAGLSLSNIFSLRKKIMVIAGGFIGTASAFWLYNNFVNWLFFLGATLPAVGIILILDYFCNRSKYSQGYADTKYNWAAICGTVCGMAAGNFLNFGCSGINSMIAASAAWAITSRIRKAAVN